MTYEHASSLYLTGYQGLSWSDLVAADEVTRNELTTRPWAKAGIMLVLVAIGNEVDRRMAGR